MDWTDEAFIAAKVKSEECEDEERENGASVRAATADDAAQSSAQASSTFSTTQSRVMQLIDRLLL